MLRGCQKRVIHLKDTRSGLFDEAYFIIREQSESEKPKTETDMLKEARRILLDSLPEAEKRKRAGLKLKLLLLLSFSLGVVLSVAFAWLFFH